MDGARPSVLDPCCGGRMMWFDRADQRCLFGDVRHTSLRVTDRSHDPNGTRAIHIHPDMQMDFRCMPFADGTFQVVAFDPPHLVKTGQRSWMAAKYGRLGADWKEDLRRGFTECFRVLKPNGVLIFKWNETQIPVKEVLACTEHPPLFGHQSGKASKTHWMTFLKPPADACGADVIHIYTDGSCINESGYGGWAALIRHHGRETILTGSEENTSSFAMEITAVIQALSWLDGPHQVAVHTNCEQVVKGITEYLPFWLSRGWRKSNGSPVKHRELWEWLLRISGEHQISWHWLRGHAGHPDNARVHFLARQSARQIPTPSAQQA